MASWLIAHYVSYCSFKVDWSFNLILIYIYIKKKILQALKFYNAALNYAVISQLFICYGHALKSMQKWEWAKHVASAHFTQNCLLERFVSQCQFHIISWVLRTLPVTEVIPVDNSVWLQSKANTEKWSVMIILKSMHTKPERKTQTNGALTTVVSSKSGAATYCKHNNEVFYFTAILQISVKHLKVHVNKWISPLAWSYSSFP